MIVIKCESVAGSTIRKASEDLCAAAAKLGVILESNFNGVTMLASPTTTPDELVRYYEKALEHGASGP